ncbi:hypothetical protein [Robertmurraya siralis]|uniref:hypothetical protein n=1 Tax=Robertmurraya siralis TaxID=77777 RepID=UPI0010F44046|nr:hypothetical protein [Robertmurraya siralis]
MKTLLYGTLSLVISKLTKLTFEEAKLLFSDENIKTVNLVFELMDNSIHSFEVKDHFMEWEEENENVEE